MNNIIKTIGLFSLIIFSLFYSEKVMMVINEQDSLLLQIKEYEHNYYIDKEEAVIKDDTIVPGVVGRKVNINKSYNNMKKIGIFNDKLLVYDDIIPNESIANNYDKYIIKGTKKRKEVSIIFILRDIILIDNLLENNNIDITFFIDNNIFNNNLSFLYKLCNYELYNYGNNGKYTDELIIMNNNKINNIANNKANYCLALSQDKEVLDVCSLNKMNTIIPNIIENNNNYNNIKNNISNGSIIVLEITNKNINELKNINAFIKGKGYIIVPLSKLLEEKRLNLE